MLRLLTSFSLLVFLLAGFSFAQEPKVEWGKVPLEDLLMTSFPDDSNATAVILYDYGESKFNDNLEIVFQRHMRIKILNEKGYDWGTHKITLYTKDNTERLSDLEAITYSLDKNDQVVQNELDDDNIFEDEESDDYTSYKFTMPALKPGCVIDVRYTIITTSIYFLRDWTFQFSEPVIWSEYKINIPRTIFYAFVLSGYQPWYIQDNTEVNENFRGRASALLGPNPVKCLQYRLVVHFAPALRDEPYITTIEDYQNRVQAQLAGYAFFGYSLQKVLRDWQTVVNELLDNNSFEDKIDVTGDVEDLTDEITKGLTSPDEKLKAIYNWITKSIVWDKKQRMFAHNDVDDVLEYKKGNSAEITFLLLSMLKSAGINGDPVILSTRGNGKIQDLYPIVSQFNLTIARVKLDSTTYFIDATDPLRPLDVLPEKILNVKGLVIKPGQPEWVYISSPKADAEKCVVNLKVNENGSITSAIETSCGKYESLSLRKDLEDKPEKELVKDLFKTEESGFNLDSVEIINKDDVSLPLEIKAWISSDGYSQQGGDFLYMNPILINRLTDTPFKDQKRQFPVDYAYPRNDVMVTNIRLPDGYELKENYENKHFTMSNKASFRRSVQTADNNIQILCKTEINESRIAPEYYSQLKYFYSEMIAAESEMLVLGKKATQIDKTENIKIEGKQ